MPNIAKLQAKADVRGLIKALRHKDTTVRRNAAEALRKLGDAAVEPLLAALGDG